MNKLYFGDNLLWLKEFARTYPMGFIDLVYIDPPFNSKRNYNILFETADMTNTKAQKTAFADTWSNVSYIDTLAEIQKLHLDLHKCLKVFDELPITKGAISYLTIMAIRLYYIHKLLKPTGSFYLHCDPTMSHYLKIICDLIFKPQNFRNEISWCKSTTMYQSKTRYVPQHDIILFYVKGNKYIFNWRTVAEPFSDSTIKKYKHKDKNGRRFRLHGRNLTGSPIKNATDIKIKWLKTSPELCRIDYLEEKAGVKPKDWWVVNIINQAAKERLGYPTQKPEALLERIIKASSNEGDVVADFFCGCGTTIAVAEKLHRKWIGADISHLAIKLITKRLIDTYGKDIRQNFEIFGFPEDIESAKMLAKETKRGRLKFEEWIVEVKLHGILNENRTKVGHDGYLLFGFDNNKYLTLIEVKSGNASLSQLNHFIQTVDKKKAAIGIFVCFAKQLTHRMKQAAKQQGLFDERFKADKIQLLTVEELLKGGYPNIPAPELLFKKATAQTKDKDTQGKLF